MSEMSDEITKVLKLLLQGLGTASPEARKRKLARWGEGPWVDEPDQVEWKAYEHPCALLRNQMEGTWVGYSGVPAGHPWHGQGLAALSDVDVHGGVTFAGPMRHALSADVDPAIWWVGFDCAHGGLDLIPSWRSLRSFRLMEENGAKYRDVEYCVVQASGLALQAQLAQRALPSGDPCRK